MANLAHLRLKKGEDRRIRSGHPWIYSNEIDTSTTPLKNCSRGEEVIIESHDKTVIGRGYVNPHSLIAVRLFSQDANQELNQDFFVEKIQQALMLRNQLFLKPYYRLVYGESDQLPGIVIDRFENDFVVQINTAGMELKIDNLVAALQFVFPDIHSILLKNDSQIRMQEGLEIYSRNLLGTPPADVKLVENDVSFFAPLESGQKTGWFYDHRLNRARLKQYVSGKSVLDVFSYVGGWGIQAAAFGASHVDCIEGSSFATEYVSRNAILNHCEDKVKVICDDAFDAMKKLVAENKSYDVIILDPPAFVKKFKDKKEGWIAYQRLNEFALKLLTPGGILFSCSCSMHMSMEDMIEMLKRSAYRSGYSIQILERGHQGPDHPLHISIPETDYLKMLVVRKI